MFQICRHVSWMRVHINMYSSVSSRKVVTRYFKILELHILPCSVGENLQADTFSVMIFGLYHTVI